MIQKFAAALALLAILPSCDKKQASSASDSDPGPGPRTTRADRPSRNVPSTRERFRAALEAAMNQESVEARDEALAELALAALDPAPDIASQAIAGISADFEGKASLIEVYVQNLMEEGRRDEAMAWADSLDDERDQATARGKIALMLAETAPDQAAALLSATSFTAEGVEPVAEQVIQQWIAKDPAAAAAWTTNLPAGEARTAGYQVVFSQWVSTDSASALSWAAARTNPHDRREAISAMVEALAEIPDPIRDSLLGPAEPNIRAEIEQGIAARQNASAVPETPTEPDIESAPQPEAGPESPPEE